MELVGTATCKLSGTSLHFDVPNRRCAECNKRIDSGELITVFIEGGWSDEDSIEITADNIYVVHIESQDGKSCIEDFIVRYTSHKSKNVVEGEAPPPPPPPPPESEDIQKDRKIDFGDKPIEFRKDVDWRPAEVIEAENKKDNPDNPVDEDLNLPIDNLDDEDTDNVGKTNKGASKDKLSDNQTETQKSTTSSNKPKDPPPAKGKVVKSGNVAPKSNK